jgi:hypothetical protein
MDNGRRDNIPEGASGGTCTLGHIMLPILHFRPNYNSNGRSGGVLGIGFLRGIWYSRPHYGSNPGQIMGYATDLCDWPHNLAVSATL